MLAHQNQSEVSADTRPLARAAERITAPIPLLAFMGVIVEAIVAAIAVVLINASGDAGLRIAVVAVAAVLPLLLISCVYRLISRYPEHLYGPQSYQTASEFIAVLSAGKQGAAQVGQLAPASGRPFAPTDTATGDQLSALKDFARRWRPVLDQMESAEFFALHSWFNETQQHSEALICLAIAIAKGMVTSRNYSFIAASLRKLGRFAEAASCAELALVLEPGSPDANYNLAKTYWLMGRHDVAREHAKLALDADRGTYAARLPPPLMADRQQDAD